MTTAEARDVLASLRERLIASEYGAAEVEALAVAVAALAPVSTDDDCGSCGAHIGPSESFVWHYADEDCRAVREPSSEVLAYLTEKVALAENEWLRREPRTTHPAILALVREAEASGLSYNDDAERYVNEKVGDLPPHERHGHGRNRLIDQLGHEVYLAKGILTDERNQAKLNAALAEGYARIGDVSIEHGKRYDVRCATLYSGYSVASYHEPKLRHRAHVEGSDVYFMAPRARTRGFRADEHTLVREARA